MRARSAIVAFVVVGCAWEVPDPTDEETDAPPEDTGETGSTGTDTGTVPLAECYADWETDVFDDGTIDGTGRDTYDPLATHRLLSEERDFPGDFDDVRVEYAYDANGFLALIETDYRHQSRFDLTEERTWDAAGNMLSREVDNDGDGSVDFAYAYAYDAAGLRIETLYDSGGDGTVDAAYEHTYDAEGRIIATSADWGLDGVIESTETTSYSDPVLAIGVTEFDDDNSGGPPDRTREFEHDAEGHLVYSLYDICYFGQLAYGYDDRTEDCLYTAIHDPVSGTLTQSEYSFTTVTWDYDYEYFYTHTRDSFVYDDSDRRIDQLHELLDDAGIVFATYRYRWTFGGSCP